MEIGKINLTFSSLNVNSLNVSTLGGKVSKTFVKIEGITGKKGAIFFCAIVGWEKRGQKWKRCSIFREMGSTKFTITRAKIAGE